MEINYTYWPHAKGFEDRIVEVGGHLRYKPNRVVKFLLDSQGGTNLNTIWNVYAAGAFSLEEMMEFYRLIGYSLEGFEEIWYQLDPETRQEPDSKET